VTKDELNDLKAGDDKELELRTILNKAKTQEQKLLAIINKIESNEKNPRLRKALGLED